MDTIHPKEDVRCSTVSGRTPCEPCTLHFPLCMVTIHPQEDVRCSTVRGRTPCVNPELVNSKLSLSLSGTLMLNP